MPPEDYFESDGRAFVVADGITRDPDCQIDLNERNVLESLKYYPNPSGARFAAEKACQEFMAYCSHTSDETVRDSLIKANRAVKILNDENIKYVDYLINDYWGCVAAAAVIKDDKLFWGVIGDCEVVVFSNSGQVKLKSPNSMEAFDRAVEVQSIKFDWAKPQGRKKVRSQFRNNPDQIINGECTSYGAITGESSAEKFIYTGEFQLENGDLVLLYTDGFAPTIFHQEFFGTCYSKGISEFEQKLIPFNLGLIKSDPIKFGKERTLLGFIF